MKERFSKNLVEDTDLKIMLLNCQNNYVARSSIISNAAKNFDVLATSLSVPHNYHDDPTGLFSDLYLAKFLDASAKSFFPRFFHVSILHTKISKCKNS